MSDSSKKHDHTPLSLKGRTQLPLVVLRDAVVFPGTSLPLIVQRPKSLAAIDAAMKSKHPMAMFVAQKNDESINPGVNDFYHIGTIGKIKEVTKTKEGAVKVLIEGVVRAHATDISQTTPYFKTKIEVLEAPISKKTERTEVLMYSCVNQFRECVSLGAPIPLDIVFLILNVSDPWAMADLIATNLDLKVPERQAILAARDAEEKLEQLRKALGYQLQLFNSAKKLQAEVGKELDKMQREMFLREQLKAIERELGVGAGSGGETDEIRAQIEKTKMPQEVRAVALKELGRMEKTPQFSPELSYIRTYLDWLIRFPWGVKSTAAIDLKKARTCLDEDHAGLNKVKERMLEHLAVQKRVGKLRGPILCFVGPPGTGKTSIAQSVARAMGRKFVRLSLGGVRDESEIRGFRRTYVGALPGRIIQGLATAGTENPVFVLDEIDKMGFDGMRGDPSAALLEALDPEQNKNFNDHYFEVPVDCSDAMFITTANVLDDIPHALRDRLEIIEFSGYTEEEKLRIAEDFLLPRTLTSHGLSIKELVVTENALRAIIQEYTAEAGVRELERMIATLCRKVAYQLGTQPSKKSRTQKTTQYTIDGDTLIPYLGLPKYNVSKGETTNSIGVATGLAWTSHGGDILPIEVTTMEGKGKLILTGNLGTVMQESAQAAYSYARSFAKQLKIKQQFHKSFDMHVHVPSGGIPKDGPSAGMAIASALISSLTGQPIMKNVGMTGEITLRGKIMPIGGLKEKILAAHRSKLDIVIFPKENERDLSEIPDSIRKKMRFVMVDHIDAALPIIFGKIPKA